jgi:hypothetical protein
MRTRPLSLALALTLVIMAGGRASAGATQVGCGPGTPEGWQALFGSLPTYGDGNMSSILDSGRCAIVTGDAIARDGGAWAHSTITVLSGGTGRVVRPAYPGTPSPYQAIPDRGDGTVDWLGPAFFANGRLYSFAPRIRPTGGGGWENIGVNVATFDVPRRGDPRFASFLPTPTAIENPVYWSGGVYYDEPTRLVYVFGASAVATDGWTGHDVYAARVPLASLGVPARWSYFAAGGSAGTWSPVQQDATPVLRSSVNGGAESAFSVFHDAHGWAVTSKRGGQWGPGEVVRWSTPALGEPWTETVLANIPGDNYLHIEHWALPLTSSGRRLLTYNTAGLGATWVTVEPSP